MAANTEEQPDSGHKEFAQRISELIQDSGGSVYALAKKVGMPANSIRRYLHNSEPTRPFMVAIAHHTGVSIEWLATGQGAKDIQPRPPSGEDFHAAREIRNRLKELNLDASSLTRTSQIERRHLERVLLGVEDATGAEIVTICYRAQISLFWVLTGIGPPRITSPDDEVEIAPLENDDALPATIRTLLFYDVGKLLSPLKRLKVVSHLVRSDAMSPKINRGDIVIAERGSNTDNEIAGTYLVQDNSVKDVCYLSKDGQTVHISYENSKITPRQRVLSDSEGFKILGRVLYRIALQKY